MKKNILSLVLLFVVFVSHSATFIATADGNWNDGATWGNSSPGTEGVDFPGVDDDAYTNGFTITITATARVNNLFVQFDVDNGIDFNSSSRRIEIHGTLVGWDGDDGGGEEIPDTDVIDTDEQGELRFITDGSPYDGSDNIIFSWSTDATLFRVTYDPNNISTVSSLEDADIQIASGGRFRVDDGILNIGTNTISGTSSTNSVLNIRGGGTLNALSNISGFDILDIDASGVFTTTGYINSTIALIDGTLNTSFSGASQTQGWWQTTNSPSTITIGSSSTISFSASANQSIPSQTYGNLTLSGSGTKNLVSQVSGTLVVQGDFLINSANVTFTSGITSESQFRGDITNNGTWTTSANQDIRFNGSSMQAIGGSSAITFNDNIIIANSSGVDFNVDVTFASSISDNNNPMTFSQDFIFNGSIYNQGSSVITFDGSSQQISGTGDINFRNLTLSGATLSNNSANASLSGLLSMSTSSLDADGSGSGSFTLISDANGTANVGNLSGSTVSGNWTVQRYFDGSGDVWRNFGVAVNGATVSNITSAGFTVNGNDLAYYDESVSGGVDEGWVLQSTFGSSLSNTRGYSMWTRDTDVTGTVSFTGTLNAGNQNMSVTRNGNTADDGWNLVNNPYASSIDWDLLTRSNLDGTVSIWNTSTGTYDTWNGTTGTGALSGSNGVIASGQSFWVHSSSGSPSLTITEADKVSSSATFLRSEPLANHLRVGLKYEGKSVDESVIHFRDDATDGFDREFDGMKLNNLNGFNLSSVTGDTLNLSINSMGALVGTKSIRMNISHVMEGTYTLTLADVASFVDAEVILVDHFLNSEEVLNGDFEYNFSVTSDENSFGKGRFELRFEAQKTITSTIAEELNNTTVKMFPNPVGNEYLEIEISEQSKYKTISLYNTQGRTILTRKVGTNKNLINMSGFKKGIYFVHLTGENTTSIYKILKY